MYILVLLKFTPLEFETSRGLDLIGVIFGLKFTPLEFETFESSHQARGTPEC